MTHRAAILVPLIMGLGGCALDAGTTSAVALSAVAPQNGNGDEDPEVGVDIAWLNGCDIRLQAESGLADAYDIESLTVEYSLAGMSNEEVRLKFTGSLPPGGAPIQVKFGQFGKWDDNVSLESTANSDDTMTLRGFRAGSPKIDATFPAVWGGAPYDIEYVGTPSTEPEAPRLFIVSLNTSALILRIEYRDVTVELTLAQP